MKVTYTLLGEVMELPLSQFIGMAYSDPADRKKDHYVLRFIDPLVINLVCLLVKTRRITIDELLTLLPHKNYDEIISVE
jgi:hypothetical protein